MFELAQGPVVYVLACADGSFYAGWTVDLRKRLAAHNLGRAARYTRSRLPFALAAWWQTSDNSEARRQEAAFKRLTRPAKVAVLSRSQGFASGMRNAPFLLELPDERSTMANTPPTGDELTTLAEEARNSQVRIKTKKGDIVFTFFANEAPQHAAAFLKLARSGFYDGTIFHRIEPGFVIQGGDPDGNGTGGPGYQLDAEFNDHPHLRGTVAMARSANPNSAGSQFYICLDDARFLDKQYTVFGQTQEGLEVIDQIRKGDVMEEVAVEPKAG